MAKTIRTLNEHRKTEICLFYKQDIAAVNLRLGDMSIHSKKEINVLGVLFDSKLQWYAHISKVIIKANRALNSMLLS